MEQVQRIKEKMKYIIDSGVFPDAVYKNLEVLYEKELDKLVYNKEGKCEETVISLVEFLLRYYVILCISNVVVKDDEKYEDIKYKIKETFNKNVTMGIWGELLKDDVLCPSEEELPSLYNTVKELRSYCNETKIIKNRNKQVAHKDGVFTVVGGDKENNVKKYIDRLCDFLIATLEWNKNISLFTKENKVWIHIDENIFSCYPFMLLQSEKLFLFDGKWGKPEYKKDLPNDEEIIQITEEIGRDLFVTRSSCSYDKMKVDRKKVDERLNEMHKNTKYFTNKTIVNWYESCLEKEKGVFLLTMDRGSGKTAFVASKDPKLNKKKDDDSKILIRCYYCNKQQYDDADDFIRFCNNNICDDLSLIHPPQMAWDKNLAQFLNEIKEECQKEKNSDVEKIVIIIDGVDEIASFESLNDKTIMDVIPEESELDSGIYIILTCRSGFEQIERQNDIKLDINSADFKTIELNPARFIQERLEKIPIKNKLMVLKNDRGHQNAVKAYLKFYLPDYSEASREEIAKQADYNFVDLKLYAKLVDYSNKQVIADFKGYEDAVEYYMEMMKAEYGELSWKILANIVYSKRVLYVGELIDLSSDKEWEWNEKKTLMKYIEIINDLEPFIFYGRTKQGTVLVLNNVKYERYLKTLLKDSMKKIVNVWVKRISISHQEEEAKEKQYTKSFYREMPIYAQAYMHAYAYEYMGDLEIKELEAKILSREFVHYLISFENHRKSNNQFGNVGVLQDIMILDTAIEITSIMSFDNTYDEYLKICMMYNDRTYLYALLNNYDEVGKNTIYLEDKIIQLQKKAITENKEKEFLVFQGKIYNNRGSWEYQKAKPDLDSSLYWFQKGLEIRTQLIAQDGDTFKERAEECLLSYRNVLSVYARKGNLTESECKAADEYYVCSMDLLNRIKEFIKYNEGKSLETTFNLNSYRDHRLDYGYAFLETQLERFYGQLYASRDYDDASKHMERAIEKLKVMATNSTDVTILKAVIQCYLEAARMYQNRANRYLENASEVIEQWDTRGNIGEDSRFAEVYYRLFLNEKLNQDTSTDRLNQLKKRAEELIKYITDQPEKKYPESALHMQALINGEKNNIPL